MEISEIINHLGEERSEYYNAVSPPVMKTSNFCFRSVAEMRANIDNEFTVPFYTRGNNPTVTILRKKMAALEKTEDALITSSGCAAISAAVIANLSAGDHVICVQHCYSWTKTLFMDVLKRFRVEVDMIDGTRTEHFRNVIRHNTRMIYLESPGTFMMDLQDLKAVAELAKQHKILTIIDNSYATPLLQNPKDFGIDIIVHSASKYLGGHSDLIAGVICADQAMIRKIFEKEYLTFGGIITPENAWLMLRGLRTLPLRLKQIQETTRKVVDYLEHHPKVEKVMWPFAAHNPQLSLAQRQMKGAGGLFSFLLRTHSVEKADLFCDSLKHFLLACSWGGHESLVYPASVLYDTPESKQNWLPMNLVRMYVGLEEADYLIADIDRALDLV